MLFVVGFWLSVFLVITTKAFNRSRVPVEYFSNGLNSMNTDLDADVITVEIISVGNFYPTSISSFPYAAPAMDVGMQQLRSLFRHTNILFKHTYLYDIEYHYCDEITANVDRLTAEYYYKRTFQPNVTAFIAPGCTERINLSRLLRAWNALMMVGGNGEVIFREKQLFPNVVLAGTNAIKSYTTMFLQLCALYNWKSISIVLDFSAKPFHLLLAPNLHKALTEPPEMRINFIRTGPNHLDFQQALFQIRRSCRIVIFLGFAMRLRIFMTKAFAEGMANGDYVYFATEPFRHSDYGNLAWNNGDELDQDAFLAFKSLFVVTAAEANEPTADISRLYQDFKNRSQRDYNFTYPPNEQPNPFVTASYESFLMFGTVLDEVISEGSLHDLADGSSFAARFWNRTFELATGAIEFDSVGERKTALVAKQFLFNGTALVPVILLNSSIETLEILQNVKWATNWPPHDEPACGFLGISGPCSASGTGRQALILSLSVVVTCVALSSFCTAYIAKLLARNVQLKANDWMLQGKLLRIPHTELSTMLTEDYFTGATASGVGLYHNTSVWFRKFPVSNHLKQSKQAETLLTIIKSVSHYSINPFIGLIFEPETVMLISNYCRRGSLQDVIHTKVITLDWRIKISCITDLLNGIVFVHSSSLRVHGHLTSSKCLLSNHLTVQIGGLGYDKILSDCFGTPYCELELDPDRFMWLAPELLYHKGHRTPEGDIFAVGVILQEITQECYPHRLSLSSALLPTVFGHHRRSAGSEEAAILTLSKQCLSTHPNKRPTAKSLLKEVSVLFGKNKPQSILGDLISRLQHYSDELELAVMLRTQQITEENESCDHMLLELLPKFVVEQLRAGKEVVPQYVDQITISFSQISEFLDFTARSSPFAVVETLNIIYSLYDEVIGTFDAATKLQVASGLPNQTETNHAVCICRTAISLRKRFQEAKVNDEHDLHLQFGINTGPCVAGIVGFKIPKYSVFGDTINVAGHVCSLSERSKIHVHQPTTDLVKASAVCDLVFVNRGFISVKGQTRLRTYWLEESDLPVYYQ